MQRNEVVQLNTTASTIANATRLILDLAKGKSVLNVGAAGNVEFYLPSRRHLWLHHQLQQVAEHVTGLDIDTESVRFAESHGFEIVLGNCEDIDLGRRFDLIVLSEVFEHLDAPGIALKNLMQHVVPGGKIALTTPNPLFFGTLCRALLRRKLNIYYDHVNAFFPEHLQAMCDRYGYRLVAIHFFTPVEEQQSRSVMMKSYISRGVGAIFPRLHANFFAVVEPA